MNQKVRFGAAIALCAFVAPLFAQNSSSITGTVRDSTGAVVSGAEVTVINTGTKVATKTTTNTAGDYLVGGLRAGTYDVTVTNVGFKKSDVTGVVIDVASKAKVDVNLEVGQVSTEVNVKGESAAQVETQSAELSGVVTGKEISQVVLNGRNFVQLVKLVPGVSDQTGQDEGTVGVNGNVAMSFNGGRTEYNNWEVDGGDNMDNGSNATLNVYPNVDAIAEVRVLTSNYGAQYGRNGSGTVETITKSGTTQFHGDAFEFVRNDAFNARNFFQSSVPEYKKNDFGYTIGGPVFIPNFYNTKKEKTFFFFSEDWRREIVPGATFHTQVPNAAERTGNFADVCPAAGSAVNTAGFPDCPVDPSTKQYYPNNTVPVDPNAQNIMSLLPAANAANNYYNAAPATPTHWREELFRIDQNFSDQVRMFVRFIHDSWSTVTPTPLWGSGASFPLVKTNFVGPGVSLVANLTANITPTLLNEFTFSYTADHIFLNALGPVQRPSNMTMTGLFNNGFGGLLPTVNVGGGHNYDTGGFSIDTGYFPWNNANPTYNFKDQASKIVGSHNLTMGALYIAAQKNEQNSPYIQGILNFNINNPLTTGNAFADFLQGNIAAYSQTNRKAKFYNRYKVFEPYFQDDWHVNKRLTVNLGLRVSLFGTYRERYKQAYNFDPATYSAAAAPKIDVDGSVTGFAGAIIPGSGNPYTGQVQCGTGGVPVGCMKGHLFNPAPRVGFAYDPFGDGKSSIRGAYGVFFEHSNGNEGNTESLEGFPPYVLASTQYNIPGYTSIGGGGVSFPFNVNSIPRQAIWPYMQQWNVSIQRELMPSTVLTVAYVASKGTHLSLQRDLNQLTPIAPSQNPFAFGQPLNCSASATGQAAIQLGVACGGSPAPYRPYIGFGTITSLEYGANSTYNALQVSAHRHVGRLSFDLAYTWSHSLDDSSDRGDGSFVNSFNLALTRASSNFDQRQILNVGYVYDLPFFTQSGMMHSLLGGWQISGLTTFQTGTPFSVINGIYGAGVGNGVGTGAHLDTIKNPAAKPNQDVVGVQGPLLYNPNAFAETTGLTFGTSQRNALNNPSRIQFDMGLFKHFAITEKMGFEFRAEGFNVFNHTQWNGINNVANCFGDATTGYSAGAASCLANNNFLRPGGAHNPRILQLGAKFIF